jgi:hypothetical protein
MGANIGFLHLPNLTRLSDPVAAPATQTSQAATTAEPTTAPTQRNDIYFVGYQQAPAGRLFRSGNLPFIRRDTAQETGEYSYMLYFWDDSRKEFYQLPAGRMRLLQGASLRGYDLLNLLTQDPQGQLKVYTSPQVNGLVSQAVLAFLNTNPAPSSVSFTPQRLPTRVADARIEVGYYNYGSDTYFSIEGRPSRLARLANQTRDTIQRSDMPVGGTATASATPSITLLTVGGTATASATPSITLLSRSQLKTLATSPYSFGFGIEFEGFVREGTRKELSEKMREDGIKIYTTTGYRSKTPVRGEEPYRRGAKWRQESDGSVEGYDARSSGGSDPRGQGQTFEMVSVILNSSADNKSGNNTWIPELETYCDSLAKNGVLIDPSSGIHIHVGHPNFNAEQTKNLFINSVLMIPVLKGLVSEAWKDRGYARFPNDSNLTRKLSDIANAANDQRSVVRAYRGQFGSERYSYLNTSNFTSTEKPTFEYRFQGSSIEKDTMINTVRILQQIWKASLQGVIPIEQGSGKQQDSVLVDLFGKELFSFARNRYAETELPLARDRSSKKFPGYKFPINASSIT